MKVKELPADEYAEWQKDYLALVDDSWSVTEEMEISLHNFIKFVQDIPMDKYDYRYAEGKWTIKEIIQHIIDSERILSYRALCIARGDTTAMPGFNQDNYVANSVADQRHLQSLLNELSLVRHSSIALFKSFLAEDFAKKGNTSDYEVSVRALGFIIIGHQNHHIKIFKERYL